MTASTLDLAVLQVRPYKGHIAGNLPQLRSAFAQLAADPPQLILMPEAALTGYFLEGATAECAVSAEEFAAALAQCWREVSTAPVEIVCGFYENYKGTFYNSAVVLSVRAGDYRIMHVHRKLFLPTYGVFDEARFVSRGRRLHVVDCSFGVAAVAICEDMWHSLIPTLAAVKGARFLFVPSASPGRGLAGPHIGSLTRWEQLLSQAASEHGIFVVYAGLVGFEGGKGMTGNSCVVNPFGVIVGRAPIHEAAILRTTLDLEEISLARAALPLIGDLCEIAPDLLRDPELSEL